LLAGEFPEGSAIVVGEDDGVVTFTLAPDSEPPEANDAVAEKVEQGTASK